VDAYREASGQIGALTPELADGLEPLVPAMAGDVEAVVVSDFSTLGETFDRRIREAGARGSVSAIAIEDEMMREPPPLGLYPQRIGNDDALKMVAIRAGDENVYRDHADDHRRVLTARLLGLGMRQVLNSDPTTIDQGYFR
jgi:hypothetical protein